MVPESPECFPGDIHKLEEDPFAAEDPFARGVPNVGTKEGGQFMLGLYKVRAAPLQCSVLRSP